MVGSSRTTLLRVCAWLDARSLFGMDCECLDYEYDVCARHTSAGVDSTGDIYFYPLSEGS